MASIARRFVPLADRVLVKRLEAVTKTASGIYLPQTSVNKNSEAEVVAVGPGSRTRDGEVIAMSVKIGDKVLLPEYGGHTIKLGDDEFQLFRNDDILGVLSE